jgi:hypothetical protein
MAYYNYKWLAEKKVGFAWLDITSKIKNNIALGFTKNITEYWTAELENFGVKMSCKSSADDLLHWAADENLEFLLVMATGTTISKNNMFLQELPPIIEEQGKDITVMGHILDKEDKFYELHHQCFLVNIAWWKTAGRPEIGQEQQSIGWETIAPIRSEENWHDSYTPHYITPGTETKAYTGRRYGWNIIQKALESGQINSFSENLRNAKYYLYPEVTNETAFKFVHVHDNLQVYSHFLANTEAPPDMIIDKRINGVICTGGGATPLLTAYTSGLKPGDRLIVADISPMALGLQRALFDTKCNYKNYKEDFYKLFGSLKPDHLGHMFRADKNIPKMQEILNKLMPKGLEDFIRDVWPNLIVSWNYFNIFDTNMHKNLLSEFDETANVVIHLSNVLHYQNTSWIYDSASRYAVEEHFLKTANELGPDRFFIIQNRPGVDVVWRNHTPRQILNDPEVLLGKSKNLQILPWIKK